jgi:PhnB protein
VLADERGIGQAVRVSDTARSNYEGRDLRAVRPYLIVSDASAAIDFYRQVFGATELERHPTLAGGVGHAKIRIGETIVELGEHPDAEGREAMSIPAVGLRLYVEDVDEVYGRAVTAGASGTEPTERPPGTRAATVYDPFGLTWWLAAPLD